MGKTDYPLIYITANESDYSVDLANFRNMLKFNPGVSTISLYIIVSMVKEKTNKDDILGYTVERLLRKQKQIKLKKISFKNNIGRDFSSAKRGLELANADGLLNSEYVLITNRSALGPFHANWYLEFIQRFQSQENIGITGNTINFQGHPKSNGKPTHPHVQTYVYLLKSLLAKKLLDDFPGDTSEDRLDIIERGEIGLSKQILKWGYGMNCLYWKDEIFFYNSSSSNFEITQKTDVREFARNLPFIHRTVYSKYVGHLRSFYITLFYVGYFRKLYWNLSFHVMATSKKLGLLKTKNI